MWPDSLCLFGKGETSINKLSLRSQEDFKQILEREKARSHRTGDRSSLLVFNLDEKGAFDRRVLCPLAHSLNQRIRLIDRVGWLDQRRIGVLLPGTPPEGAWTLATCIRRQNLEGASRSVCRVYEFPSEVAMLFKEAEPDSGEEGKEARYADESGDFPSSAPHEGTNGPASGHLSRPLPPWKRGMDIVGAVLGLVFLSPMFLLVVVLIKFASPGPIFYRQERVGCEGVPFTFFKFRTMHLNRSEQSHRKYLAKLIIDSSGTENAGPAMTKMDDDPRIFTFGQLLRKSCIDELPQLINVLRGEMSLVGPRPPIPYEVAEYLRWHDGRFDVVPGMTGLWQVSGKNRLSFKEMVRLDIRYSRECNFWLDLKILFKTPFAILSQITGEVEGSKLTTEGE